VAGGRCSVTVQDGERRDLMRDPTEEAPLGYYQRRSSIPSS